MSWLLYSLAKLVTICYFKICFWFLEFTEIYTHYCTTTNYVDVAPRRHYFVNNVSNCSAVPDKPCNNLYARLQKVQQLFAFKRTLPILYRRPKFFYLCNNSTFVHTPLSVCTYITYIGVCASDMPRLVNILFNVCPPASTYTQSSFCSAQINSTSIEIREMRPRLLNEY